MRQKITMIPALLISIAVIDLFAAAPCNPNACAEAKALYQFLQDISGKQILSGQESMLSDGVPSSRDRYIFERVGKYPAVYCTDFGDVGKTNLTDRRKVVSNCVKYSDSGSIIAIQYHMIQPDVADGSGFDAMHIKGSTYNKIGEILTEGSALNTEFKKRLDEIAGYFSTMQERGVAVLWRPFHEMNGDFFWWSYQDRFKELWKYTWKYLTETKKCNNLLWVFGVNHYPQGASGKAAPSYYYPGHEYVDVLSVDIYTEYGHKYEKRVHDDLRTLGGGKPIAIAENGTMPDIGAIKADQPYWTYWCTWWGFEGSNKGNTDALYNKNYSDPSVLTRDELPHDKLHSPISAAGQGLETARPPAIGRTRIVNGAYCLSVDTHGACGRIAFYSVDGKLTAAIYPSSGGVPFRCVPSGIYAAKASDGNMSTLRLVTIQR